MDLIGEINWNLAESGTPFLSLVSVGESSGIMAVVENGESNNRVESNDTDQSKSSISKSRSNDHNQSSDQQKNVIANGNGSLLYGNGVSNTMSLNWEDPFSISVIDRILGNT